MVYMTWVEDAALRSAHTAPSVSASRRLSGPPGHNSPFLADTILGMACQCLVKYTCV